MKKPVDRRLIGPQRYNLESEKISHMKLTVDRGFIGLHRCNLESENKPYETTCRQRLHRATQMQP